MRKIALAVMLVAGLVGGAARAEAATVQITLTPEGSREIDIPVMPFPGEFKALLSSWGNVTVGGSGIVAYYVFDTQDKRHSGSQAPTEYPNPFFKIMIRTVGAPSQLLVLEGTRLPLAEGGGVFGGVTVATGPLAFLRGADFQTAVSGSTVVVTFTF